MLHAGHGFSVAQLQHIIENITGESINMGSQPWGLFKVLGLAVPLLRDLVSMRYLWNHDIRMDGSALETLLGYAPEHTPLTDAVQATIPDFISKQAQNNGNRKAFS